MYFWYSRGMPLVSRFSGSPFHRNTMLHPVIENIQLASRISPADSGDEKLAKLQSFLERFGNAAEMLLLVGTLLGIQGQLPGHSSPQRLLQQTLDCLVEMVLQAASHGPTLLVFEDAHWFDPTTTSLIVLGGVALAVLGLWHGVSTGKAA